LGRRILHSSPCRLVLPGLHSSALLQEHLGIRPVRNHRSPSWLRLARCWRLARCRVASLERGARGRRSLPGGAQGGRCGAAQARARGLAELHIIGGIGILGRRILHSSPCWLVLPGLHSSALLQEHLGLCPVRNHRSPSWLRLAPLRMAWKRGSSPRPLSF